MDKRFLTAFIIPERWNISGYWLAPYCIDHIIKLQALGSPIACKTDKVPTPADVMLFLRVCHEKRHNVFQLQPHIVDKMFIWKMQWNNDFFRSILKSIAIYIRDCSSTPKIMEKSNSEKVVNTPSFPELLSLAGVLLCKTSLTEREILTMPVGKAVWYSTVVASIEGADIKTVSTEMEEKSPEQINEARRLAEEMKEKMRLAMVNGRMPKSRIK